MDALQTFLDGMAPEDEPSIEEFEQLRSLYKSFIRLCPLRKELVNKLEECAERVMMLEKFDSEPIKESSFEACGLGEGEWWRPWV